jgi:hypothetical protein
MAPRAGKWARGTDLLQLVADLGEAGAGAGVVLITAGRAADADGAIVSLPTLIGRPPCAVTSWVSKTTGIEPSSGDSLGEIRGRDSQLGDVYALRRRPPTQGAVTDDKELWQARTITQEMPL